MCDHSGLGAERGQHTVLRSKFRRFSITWASLALAEQWLIVDDGGSEFYAQQRVRPKCDFLHASAIGALIAAQGMLLYAKTAGKPG